MAAVLNNVDRLEEIYQTAENSAGSAQREQEKYTQSVQYSLDQLTAHTEEFWSTFINTDDVKGFINLINDLISAATTLVDTFGAIPTVALGYGIFKGVENFDSIKGWINQTRAASGAISDIGFSGDTANLGLYKKELEGLTLAQQKLALSSSSLSAAEQAKILSYIEGTAVVATATGATLSQLTAEEAEVLVSMGVITAENLQGASTAHVTAEQIKQIMATEALSEAQKKHIATTLGVNAANQGQVGMLSLLKGSFKNLLKPIKEAWAATADMGGTLKRLGGTTKNLWSNMSGGGKVAIIAAIVIAINQVISAFTDSMEEIRAKIEESKQKISDTESEISSLDGQISETESLIKKMKDAGADDATIKTYEREKQLLQEQKDILEGIIADERIVLAAESARLINNEGSESGLSKMLAKLQNFDIPGSTRETPIVGRIIDSTPFGKDEYGRTNSYFDIYERGGWGWEGVIGALVEDLGFNFIPTTDARDNIVAETGRQISRYAEAESAYEEALVSGDEDDKEYWREEMVYAQKYLNEHIPTLIESLNNMEANNEDGIYDAEIKEITSALREYYKSKPEVGIKLAFKNGDKKMSDIGDILYTEFQNGGGIEDLKGIITTKIAKGSEEFQTLVESGLIDEGDKDWAKTLATKCVEHFETSVDSGALFNDADKTSLSELETLSGKIQSIRSAYDELSNDGYITVETLADIKEATGLSGDEWEEYKRKLMNAKAGSSEFNQTISELTDKMLDNAFSGKNLNSLKEEEIALVLRQNGVLNANAVAHEWLAKAKAKESLASKNFVKTTEFSKESLEREAAACGLTSDAYVRLVANEILFNRNKLSVDDKIVMLKNLAAAAGLAANKIASIGSFYSPYSTPEARKKYVEDHGDTVTYAPYNPITDGLVDWSKIYRKEDMPKGKEMFPLSDGTKTDNFEEYRLDKESQDLFGDLDESTIPDFGVGDSGGGDEPDYEDPTEAIVNRINLRSDELKQNEKYLEDNLEIAKTEKDYEKQVSLTNDLLANRINRRKELIDANAELHKEAELLRQNNPWKEELWFDSQGQATEAYYELYNSSSSEQQDKISALFESLSKFKDAYKKNEEEISNLNKQIPKTEDDLVKIYEDIHDNKIGDIEHARDMALSENEFIDTTPYYKQMQEEYHKQAEYLRSLDPEQYKEEIQKLQQDWLDAQNEIAEWSYSNSERWINERNTYDDWELYGDNEVDAWKRVLKRFETEFPNELEKINDIKENIFDAQKQEMEDSLSDIEDYISARNLYNDWDVYGDSELKAVERQTEIIKDAYEQRLLSAEEYTERLEEYSQRIYSLGQNEVNKQISNIDKYINARNHFNDWDDFNDSEIAAIKRQSAILDEAYKHNLISLEDYTERSEEFVKKLYSVAKDNIIKTISELIEDYEELKEDEQDALNLESEQYGSLKTLLQSYYDVTNAISEAQHEIDKELRASQSMYEYLNEDTRKLLFNQEDYDALTAELIDIQEAANALQEQYNEDILGASKETIAEITSQYQMQYETMMKQYEIAKAELEVAKKRQKLDNVLAERNVRMFIDGQWQWVANTQNVIDAKNELADAEIEKEKKENALKQTESINELTAAQDDITTQLNYIETDLIEIREKWDEMQEMLNGESDEVAKVLKEISKVDSPELQRIILGTGGSIDGFSEKLLESTTTLSGIITTDMGNVTLGIEGIVTKFQGFAEAIQALTNEINGINIDKDNKDKTSSGSSSGDTNATAWQPGVGEINITIDSSGNTTTKGLKPGAIVHTSGGDYKVVAPNTEGAKYNETSGYWSVKVDEKHASGTRYTPGGLTLMGEEGFEAFISGNGRLIPITQPTLGNIGAGGIVFNREQMANLRNLWDLSNLGKVSSFVSSSNTNKQSTVVDNSIHINGLTVGEQGNEDWINGLRRYVATHK